jgi:hypothetical protein
MTNGGLVRVGEMPLLDKIKKQTAPLTRAQLKLEAVATEVRNNRAGIEKVYMARQLVQCTLPHKDPGDVPVWQRDNGRVSLVIQPGWDTVNRRSLGIPYGIIPRLLLFWIVTEVKLQRKHCLQKGRNPRRIELGNNLAAFMRELGLNPNNRGPRSDAARLRDQMTRLFESRISFRGIIRLADGTEGIVRESMEVAPRSELWWNPKRPDQGTLWGSWILLGEFFYQAILASGIPADMRALKALKRSPLYLDLYVWAGLKVHEVNKNNKPMAIRWDALMAQLGAGYDPKRIDNFKGKVKAALKQVAKFFPDGLNTVYEPYALVFHPGAALAVPEKLST